MTVCWVFSRLWKGIEVERSKLRAQSSACASGLLDFWTPIHQSIAVIRNSFTSMPPATDIFPRLCRLCWCTRPLASSHLVVHYRVCAVDSSDINPCQCSLHKMVPRVGAHQ